MSPTDLVASPSAHGEATIAGPYRYDLRRHWHGGLFERPFRFVNFVMLNPSTADARDDDATVRRCIGFAKAWDYDGLVVTNLFAWRATDPSDLWRATDPIGPGPGPDRVGPENDAYIVRWAKAADLVVCAWGFHGTRHGRAYAVLELLRSAGVQPHAIATTQGGQPAHPLYLPGSLIPRPID